MEIDSKQAGELMQEVTGCVDDDVFSLGGIGLLIIESPSVFGGATARVKYEYLDETETEEWLKDKKPA